MKMRSKIVSFLLMLAMLASLGIPAYAALPDPDIELVKFDAFDNNVSTNKTAGWITNTTSDRFAISDNHLVMKNSGTGNLSSIIYYFNGAGLSKKAEWTSTMWNKYVYTLTAKMTLPDCSVAGVQGELNLCNTDPTISAKLVHLISNGDGTFDVFINNTTGGTKTLTEYLSNVKAGEWVDIVVTFTGNTESNGVTYYINGTKAGSTVTMTSMRPQISAGVYLQAKNVSGNESAAVAYFDELSFSGYLRASGLPTFTISKAYKSDDGITVEFTNRLTGVEEIQKKGTVTVDGIPADYSISSDRMSIVIEGEYTNPGEIKLDSFTDILANTLSSSAYLSSAVEGTEFAWVEYEDFSEWENTSANVWHCDNSTNRPADYMDKEFYLIEENSNPYLKIGATSSASGMYKICQFADKNINTILYGTKQNCKLMVKAKVMIPESDGLINSSGTAFEMNFGNSGASIVQALFTLKAAGDTLTGEVLADSSTDFTTTFGEWHTVSLVCDIIDGVGYWNCAFDGKSVANSVEYTLPSTVQALSIGARGINTSYVDDIACMLYTETPVFEVLDFEQADNNDITVNFSNEIDESILEHIKIGGYTAEEYKLSGDQKSITIVNRQYIPQETYTLEIDSGARDIYGGEIAEAFSDSFVADGEYPTELTVYKEGETEISGTGSVYKLKSVNPTSEAIGVTEYYAEYDVNGVLLAVQLKEADLQPGIATMTGLSFTNNSSDTSYSKLFIWHKGTIKPVALASDINEVEIILTVSSMFGDGCVIQRDTAYEVWGEANPGAEVTVEIGSSSATAVTGEDGQWTAELPPLFLSDTPYTMTVSTATGAQIVYEDILAGDVWLCSGQSNMERAVYQCDGAEENMANAAEYTGIRIFKQQKSYASAPLSEPVGAKWYTCEANSVRNCSAIGYNFAKEINEEENVPVGIINAAYSGARIERFIENSAIANGEKYQYRATKEDTNASVIYNSMIAPLTRYNIKGVLWYQGEANSQGSASQEEYPYFQKLLMDTWEKDWGFEEGTMPFLFVQLASYGSEDFKELRNAQHQFALENPNSAMAVIMDCGEENDIHPKDKTTPAHRLALAARNKVYGHTDIEYKYPYATGFAVDGSTVTVTFADVYDGLECSGEVAGFKLCGSDGVFYDATAVIASKNTVKVTCDEVSAPAGVSFGYEAFPNPVLNLYNSADIPACPFIMLP